MPKMKDPTTLKPYVAHGIDFNYQHGAREASSICPFCGSDDKEKFNVNIKRGVYACFVCKSEGNKFTFLNALHSLSLENTQDHEYTPLTEQRGIPASILREWGVCKSVITGEFLFPMIKDNKVYNLGRLVKLKGRYKIFLTPETPQYIFGANFVTKDTEHVWLCEGPWDAMNLMGALYSLRTVSTGKHELPSRMNRTANQAQSLIGKGHAVVAVPGAMQFNKDWFKLFTGKHMHLCYDNDHPKTQISGVVSQPGLHGMNRVATLSNGCVKSLTILDWGTDGYNPNLEDGYDVSDMIKEFGPAKATRTLVANQIIPDTRVVSSPGESEGVDPIECTSFRTGKKSLLSYFSALHLTQMWEDCFAIMLAVVLSTRTEGDPLWLRVIGPPSSGKTVLAECLAATKEYVKALSTFSGFVSGFRGAKNEDGTVTDASPIAMLDGKCLIVKDGDTLMSNDGKDRILAELRDLYDGVTRVAYRNQVAHDYEDLHTSIILCGTNQLRGLNRANLGERFLDAEIVGTEEREHYATSALQQAMSNMAFSFGNDSDNKSTQPKELRKRATAGFINHLMSTTQPIVLDEKVQQTILNLADFLAHMRARVHPEENDTEPEIEMPARIVTQLVKFAVCLTHVLGNGSTVGRDVLRNVRRVVEATAKGRQFQATMFLYKRHRTRILCECNKCITARTMKRSSKVYYGCTSEDIANELSIGSRTTQRLMMDMLALKLVTRIKQHGRATGKEDNTSTYQWRLTPEVYDLAKRFALTGSKEQRTAYRTEK